MDVYLIRSLTVAPAAITGIAPVKISPATPFFCTADSRGAARVARDSD